MALKKITLNVEEELLEQVQKYGDSLHINRSAAFAVLLSKGIEYTNIVNSMPALLDFVNRQGLADKGEK